MMSKPEVSEADPTFLSVRVCFHQSDWVIVCQSLQQTSPPKPYFKHDSLLIVLSNNCIL